MSDEIINSTRDKALHLNLDAAKYGTFAEIGAGQETAAWFFEVGGASGTMPSSISPSRPKGCISSEPTPSQCSTSEAVLRILSDR